MQGTERATEMNQFAPVDRAVGLLGETLVHLSSRVEDLTNRLKPVLGPVPPAEAQRIPAEGQSPGSSSPLVQSLQEMESMAGDILGEVNVILERLDL